VEDGRELLEQLRVPRNAFAGRTALITGGVRGLGEGTARLLAQCGCRVAVVDRLQRGAQVVDEIVSLGGRALFLHCDVAEVDGLNAAIDQAEAQLGPIDLFVHSAAEVQLAPLEKMAIDVLDRSYAVNVRAPFVVLRRVLPGMRERGYGVAVNMAVLEGGPFGSALGTSKAAARTLFVAAARELGRDTGVSLFSFLPGVVDTPGIHENVLPAVARCMGISLQ